MRLFLYVFFVSILLTGCSSVRDTGKGMQVGGLGSGNPVGGLVAGVGVVLEVGADVFGASPGEEDPEFIRRKNALLDHAAKMEILKSNATRLAATVETSQSQIEAAARSTCDEFRDAFSPAGGVVNIKRETMDVFVPSRRFIPPGDWKEYPHKVTTPPLSDCQGELVNAGERIVHRKRTSTTN